MHQRIDPDLLLDFPCDYVFKAFGPTGEAFVASVKQAIARVLPVVDDAMKTRASSGGKYQSVSVCVCLHNSDQLKRIYTELKKVEGLKYLL